MQPSGAPAPGSSWSGVIARLDTITARRRLALLIFIEAIALLILGQRAMNYRYTPHAWFIAWLGGLTAIVLLDVALERANRHNARANDFETPQFLTRRQWILFSVTLPIAAYIWQESRFRPREEDHWDLLGLWILLLVVASAITAWPVTLPSRQALSSRIRKNWREIAAVVAMTALGFVVRYSDLGLFDIRRRAWIFGGDEGQFVLAAREVLEGRIRNPFETGFDAHPTLWMFAQAGAMRLFGDNVRGGTILSVFLGTVTIPIFYLAMRRYFNVTAALVGGFLLATFHFHLWVSRDAQNNVTSPFFLAIVLLLIDMVLKSWNPRSAIALGIVLGLADHAYVANRLLLPIAGTVILINLALTPRLSIARWKTIAQTGVLIAIGFVFAVLPLAAYYTDNFHTFNARVNGVSIFSNQWIQNTEEITGNSAAVILWHHFEEAALLPFQSLPAGHYIVRPPLIGWPLVIPGIIGLAIVTVFFWRRPYAPFAVSFWAVTVGLFLTDGPQTNRYSMGTLLLPALATIGVMTLVTMWKWLTKTPRVVIQVVLVVFVVGSSFWSLRVAFDRDSSVYWRPELGEIANNEFAYQLRDEFPGYTTYMFGAPLRFYGGLKMLEFFAPENKGVDVEEVVTADSRRIVLTGPSLFFFPPERRDELAIVQEWYPNGTVEDHTLDNGELLYTLYIVSSPPFQPFLP